MPLCKQSLFQYRPRNSWLKGNWIAVTSKPNLKRVARFVAWSCAQFAVVCASAISYSQVPVRPANEIDRPARSSHAETKHSLHQPASQFASTTAVENLSPEQIGNITGYLNSDDRQKNLQALEYLRHVKPDAALKEQIKSIAEENRDEIVQGYARLLAADWGVTVDHKPIAINLTDFGASARLASSEIPYENSAVQSHGQAIAVQLTDQPSVAGSGFHWNAEPDTRMASNSLFSIPIPFWEVNSSLASSMPADVYPKQDFEALELVTDGIPVQEQLTDSENGIGMPSLQDSNDVRPGILDRDIDAADDPPLATVDTGVSRATYFQYPWDAPPGFTGRSSVLPTEFQQSDHFVPVEDRWRLGFPTWDRYGKGHPVLDDYPFKEGTLLDPYNLNVLKGDYPIIGQHIFYNLTVDSLIVHEFRQTPTATTPFESTSDPFSGAFFGSPDQYFYTPFLRMSFELFHGNAAFKPADWRVRLVPVLNFNFLDVDELAIVNPDVRRGTDRSREDAALEEWFLEGKLADIGPDYDFVSARVGSQFFVSDFRGFVFRDTNRGVRLFGTRLANRDQFNAVWFDQAEKDTNSELNTFQDRHQNVLIFNYFRQDFIFPGYVAQTSFLYNQDKPSFKFDDNDNLVRPDPAGVFKPHEIDAYYVGIAGEGHIGRINVSNQIYFVFGEDSANPIAGREQDINAQMAALELSYDRDWIRFRTSYFFASGDDDPNDGQAKGFDTVLDSPVFAGGEFSYWQRQSIKLFGTNLVQRKSLIPNLRSSKIQGQSNFVNPGLQLINLGSDIELAPKTRAIANANYLFFNQTEVLETFTFQNKIDPAIGADLSLGIEYRPLLNDNAIIVVGIATLIPAQGLKDLYGTQLPDELDDIGVGSELQNQVPQLTSAFVELVLAY